MKRMIIFRTLSCISAQLRSHTTLVREKDNRDSYQNVFQNDHDLPKKVNVVFCDYIGENVYKRCDNTKE